MPNKEKKVIIFCEYKLNLQLESEKLISQHCKIEHYLTYISHCVLIAKRFIHSFNCILTISLQFFQISPIYSSLGLRFPPKDGSSSTPSIFCVNQFSRNQFQSSTNQGCDCCYCQLCYLIPDFTVNRFSSVKDFKDLNVRVQG